MNLWWLAGLIAYASVMLALTLIFCRGELAQGKESFLLANRSIGLSQGSFSIAATWIWAPALFLAAQKGYEQGLAGVFWFIVPNVATLVIFGFFAEKLRKQFPSGYTLSGFIKERYSRRVQNLYIFQLSGLAICSFAVQLLAGAAVLSMLTGISYWILTVVLASMSLMYSWVAGLRGSVVTDYVQMTLILIVCLTVVPWTVVSAGGLSSIVEGLGGVSGEYGNILNGEVFLTFGIAVTIGLLAGPFGDQSFWQRAFAVKDGAVRKTFSLGAVIFAIVPISLSLLGFIAAGSGMSVSDSGLVNLAVVEALLPSWVVIFFVIMLISGLVSTLDSNLCSISTMAGSDLTDRKALGSSRSSSIMNSRLGMVALAILATAIANIPKMEILYLFLFYGTLRASTLLPTVMSILSDRIAEHGIYYGILVSLCFGLPIFAYARLAEHPALAIFGSLFTVLASGGVAWTATIVDRRRKVAHAGTSGAADKPGL